jgi:hypothetical protein
LYAFFAKCLRRQWRWLPASGSDHRYLTIDQFDDQRGQSFISAFCPAILNRDILTFEIPGLAQALAKRIEIRRRLGRRPSAKKPNRLHRRLLRAPRAAKWQLLLQFP